MGRKLVRENELLRSGGLLSFPRTGCALCAAVVLSRALKSRHHGQHQPPDETPAQRPACPRFAPISELFAASALSSGGSAVFPYNLAKYSLKINLPSTLLKHYGNEFLLDSSCPNLLHAIS
jgi:hypothetical protein